MIIEGINAFLALQEQQNTESSQTTTNLTNFADES